MIKQKILLSVDDREDIKIFELLETKRFKEFISSLKIEIEITKQRLLIGDYLFNNVCCERKTLPDFVSSVRSGHLQEQLANMQSNYNENYLLISGNISECHFNPFLRDYSTSEYVGSLASLSTNYNARILIFNNDSLLLKFILKLAEKQITKSADKPIFRLTKTKEDRVLQAFCCCEGIGYEKAKTIMTKYPKISSLCQATSEELKEIDGIGEKLANNIKDVFY